MDQRYAPRLVLAGFGGSYAYLLASLLLFFVLHPFFEEGQQKISCWMFFFRPC